MTTTDPDEAARTPQVQQVQIGNRTVMQCASAGSAAASVPVPNDDFDGWFSTPSIPSHPTPPNPETNPNSAEGTAHTAAHSAPHFAAHNAHTHNMPNAAEGLQHSQSHGQSVVNPMMHAASSMSAHSPAYIHMPASAQPNPAPCSSQSDRFRTPCRRLADILQEHDPWQGKSQPAHSVQHYASSDEAWSNYQSARNSHRTSTEPSRHRQQASPFKPLSSEEKFQWESAPPPFPSSLPEIPPILM